MLRSIVRELYPQVLNLKAVVNRLDSSSNILGNDIYKSECFFTVV